MNRSVTNAHGCAHLAWPVCEVWERANELCALIRAVPSERRVSCWKELQVRACFPASRPPNLTAGDGASHHTTAHLHKTKT